MKKGTKVWYYKSSTVNFAAQGTVKGVKDGEVVLTAEHKIDRKNTRDVYLKLPRYAVFTSKEALDEAVVSGVKVWVTYRGDCSITEGVFNLSDDKVRINGTMVGSFHRVFFMTVEEAAKYLQAYVASELKKCAKNVRDAEETLLNARRKRQSLESSMRSIKDRIAGKNKLLKFGEKKKNRASREYEDD